MNSSGFKTTILAAALLAASGLGARAEKVTLTFADHAALTHYLSTEGSVYFMKRATELSNGEIEWRHFPAEQMAKANGILEAVKTDRVDAGLLISQYVSDRLPLNGVGALPGLIENTTQGTTAYWSMVKTDSPLRQEFLDNGVVPVGTFLLPPYQIMMRGGPITDMEGFKGAKVRTSGGSQNLAIKLLGSSPIQVPSPDLYLALDRGTVDGAIFSFLSAASFKLDEVVKSASTNANFGSVPMALVINKQKFEGLPPAIQKALQQAGAETLMHIASYMDTEEAKKADAYAKAGVKTYAFSPAMLKSINATLEPALEDWVSRLEKRKLDASAVLTQFRAALKGN